MFRSGEVRLITSSRLVDCLRTEMPCRTTSSGSCGWASATRFWTFTWAMSGSEPTSNVTCMFRVPSLPLVDAM